MSIITDAYERDIAEAEAHLSRAWAAEDFALADKLETSIDTMNARLRGIRAAAAQAAMEEAQ